MADHIKPYEVLYIIKPDLSDGDVSKITDRFKQVVVQHGGTVDSAEKWDKRRLAYEIKGQKEGIYILMKFNSPAQLPAELNRLMRISEDVMRHMITTA